MIASSLYFSYRAVEGKVITSLVTREDTIVYANTTHEDFAKHVRGQRVVKVGRLGKYFYLALQTAPHILLHLGMAGFVSTRGQEPLFYRKKAKNWKNDDGSDWPLRYWKFALTMDDGSEWCFCDSRRLGRIKLVGEQGKDITEAEPLSLLGRDPYLDMPTLSELSEALLKRKAPVKAVLLNQNGPLCGIGNWLVDEILFQAAVHPSQRGNTLSTSQLLAIHTQIVSVINTAVEVNADHAKFPKHWLFKYRWGKGRRNEPATFALPDGTIATVRHETVGGRTSAIVDAVQKLIGDVPSEGEEGEGEVSEGADEEDYETKTDGSAITPRKMRTPRKASASSAKKAGKKTATPAKRKRKAKKEETDGESDLTALEDSEAESPAKVEAVEVKVVTKRKRAAKVEIDETGVELSPIKKARKLRKATAAKEEEV